MLDTTFHRPPGDVGHAASWPFPVLFGTVSGATARRVVDNADAAFDDAFVAAGEILHTKGAIGLTTSCGFLGVRQTALAARLPLPIATSSLLQIPSLARTLPRGARVGVVTYDAAALTRRHFEAVGADPETPCIGLPAGGHFHDVIERGLPYRRAALEGEVLASVERLLAAHAGIAAIVFECTNLPPFAGAVRRRFGLPVYDVLTLGTWLYNGLVARDFPEDAPAR